MKYLVTGGAGFIGSNIVEELIKRGDDVRVLDNFSTGKRENIKEFSKSIELIEGDIRSYHIVQLALKDVDVVFHQAALPSVPRSIKDPITTNEVNIGGTLNLLEASVNAGISKFVFASSSSVYGDNPELPKHEEMTPNPLSPYAVSKLAGENYCRVFNRIYGLNTICLRYFNVFGPRQDPNSQYSAVIPKFINLITNEQSPIIFGDGTQSRDFTFVKNVVKANLLASKTKKTGEIVNIACHEQTSLNSLVAKINQLTGKKVVAIHEKTRSGDIQHSFARITKAKEVIEYEPEFDFETGLKSTIKFYNK